MDKSAEILCIGTELLMGDTVNTNASAISRGLAGTGINVYRHTVVGDNPQRLRDALDIAFSRADIVITTGGLGPTYDDLSKETVAEWFGLPLELHEQSLKWIEQFFAQIGRGMTENNRKQAMMPKGCAVFPNPNGTAPGCAVEKDGKTAILLPGPPREMTPMFERSVLPYLQRFSDHLLVSRNLRFFGIGEAALEQELRELMAKSGNPTVAPYAKAGEVMIRVTARVREKAQAPALIDPVVEQIRRAAGDYLYGVDVPDLQTAVVRQYQDLGLKLACAESCTGGMIAERITGVAGASGIFEYGVCSYSNRMKREALGVREDTLRLHGAVSEETAREMASGARRVSGADVAVAVTGNAGPDASEGKPVGLVYVAVDSGWHSEAVKLTLSRQDDDAREYIRGYASLQALDLALRTARMRVNQESSS